MLILNDVHIGVQRKGGTTPASQQTLRKYLFTSFEEALYNTDETTLLIAGDLFDEFEVAPRDWLDTYLILSDWCVKARDIILMAGNHDWQPRADRVSSFEMLARVLVEQFGPDRVKVVGIDQSACIEERCYALAHCSNQQTFDTKLSELLQAVNGGNVVVLHANYDNNFAANSDHSLNVTTEQARAFIDRGVTLVFAHEHQARTAFAAKLIVMGNQWPTSISDCLENDKKFAHVIHDGVVSRVDAPTWTDANFIQIGWNELEDVDTDVAGFYRVCGTATAGQAAEVINAIARFRQKSKAFVITNAVKVDGIAVAEALPEAFEAAKVFDVMDFIRTNTTEAEYAAILKLREPQC